MMIYSKQYMYLPFKIVRYDNNCIYSLYEHLLNLQSMLTQTLKRGGVDKLAHTEQRNPKESVYRQWQRRIQLTPVISIIYSWY